MKLKTIAEKSGMTMKELAKKSNIPYTTLMRWDKKGVYENKQAIADGLSITLENLDTKLNEEAIIPFVKWVGGKRQLLLELEKLAPSKFNNYFEPFIGGGAFLLDLKPHTAYIGDMNEELINTWNTVKNNPNELITELNKHQELNSKEHYLDVRSVDRDGRILKMSNIERAARFIYLNKAGFNGLWRVNSRGQNNVPYANPRTMNLTGAIKGVSEYLQNNSITIKHTDFLNLCQEAQANDFIYLDPPYIPVTPTAAFTSYTKDGFGLVQQEQLRNTALELAHRGVYVMLSNADVPLIYELYNDPVFHIHHVQAKRMINSNGKKRGAVGEVIITTY